MCTAAYIFIEGRMRSYGPRLCTRESDYTDRTFMKLCKQLLFHKYFSLVPDIKV